MTIEVHVKSGRFRSKLQQLFVSCWLQYFGEFTPYNIILQYEGHLQTRSISCGVRGGAVVEALRYKPEDSGFVSRWWHWIFSLT
jgi:hypothetical protein